MLLTRAINDTDLYYYNEYQVIPCNLIDSYKNIDKFDKQTNIVVDYKVYFEKKRQFSLNGMMGHVNGKKLECKRSPWISTSLDFFYVASEYAVPQAGDYNYYDKRKPIALIDMDDQKIYSDNKKIKDLSETFNDDFAIDLRNNKLEELYVLDIIDQEGKNYVPPEDRHLEFSNFASATKEVLVYLRIKGEDIKLIMYPLLQDVLYSSNIGISKNNVMDIDIALKEIYEKSDIILGKYNELFRDLYPAYEQGNNLTDLLIKYSNDILEDNIEDKYKVIKNLKRTMLDRIIKELDSSLCINSIVDDKILVKSYDKITKKDIDTINDIVLIEHQGTFYKYDHTSSMYISKSNTDSFTKDDLREKSKIKVR